MARYVMHQPKMMEWIMTNDFDAWMVRRYGGPDVLAPVRRSVPALKPDEVLINIRASAVTRADGMMRAGEPRFARPMIGFGRPRNPLVGTGLSGTIAAIGENVSRFVVGDAVFGEAGLRFGANATRIVLPQTAVLVKKPDAITHEEAAVLSDGALTSWYFLHTQSGLQPGDSLLVLGGAGSLGSAAIQIAHAMGVRVTATASARNHDLMRGLGAAHVIDYTAQPVWDRTRYDVVFDTLGVSTFGEARPALKPDGRYLSPVLNLGLLGAMLGNRFRGQKAVFAAAGLQDADALRGVLGRVLDLMAEGLFAPVMDQTFALSDIVAAHHYVATGHKRGNVVVV